MNSIAENQLCVNVSSEREGSQPDEVTYPEYTLVDDLERVFKRFLVIDDGLALVLALWNLATYLYDSFDAFPYLGITSPTKRCGKTRVAELLELTCARPLRTVGMTAPVLFRSIEQDRPTLMVDEAEGLRGRDERSSALLEILNAGYRKGQKVRRCVPKAKEKGYDLIEYETYCPKVLVLIGNLPDTLADRTIPVRMRRKRAGETVDRFLQARAKRETADLQPRCEQWATNTQEYIGPTYENANDLEFLDDREAELWLPLFVVCQIAAPDRLDDLEVIARKLAGAKAADEPADLGIRLLTDIRSIFARKSCDRLSTVDLLEELAHVEGSPWENYSHGKPLNSRDLATLLHPFGIRSKNVRIYGGAVPKGYTLDIFQDAFAIYLPPASATTLQGP